MSGIPGVEIRPEVAMYAAFARLNYAPWNALAEFVDNSLQSYLDNRSALQAIHGPSFRLHVGIEISDDRIEIHDNAAGIAGADVPRAFRSAIPPPDNTGLCEFGLGMKAAACWFSRRWSVTTSALGEPFDRTIVYDIPEITSQYIDRLPVRESPYPANDHHTHLTLECLNVRPNTGTLAKIKRHLESIYRMFLREGSVELRVQGEPLIYRPPEFLHAARFDNPSDCAVEWRKELSLTVEGDRHIWGWAGLLSKGSVVNAGFALFRRNRLIEGSFGYAYRPELLFHRSNSFIYQRLIGELNVEGFTVSHTKDVIQWDGLEDVILRQLHEKLDSEPLPLLRQAEGYRAQSALLPDVIEETFESPVVNEHARALGTDAEIVIDNESRELILVGHAYSTVAEAGQIYRGYTNSEHGIDGEVEFKDDEGRASGRRLYMQLKSGDSYLRKRRRDGAEVFRIRNPRWASYWQQQTYPVMLVIRTSDGEIRWMDVSDYLKRKCAGGKAIRQIVFEGERFDVMSVRQWRTKGLSGYGGYR